MELSPIKEGIVSTGGHINFLEINDHLPAYCTSPTASSAAFMRRSSSLQFPGRTISPSSGQYHRKASHVATALPPPSFLHSAISAMKSSSASIYASTLSAAGLLGGVGLGGLRARSGSADSTEAINLYTMMAEQRCCGLFRLRTASMLVGVVICMVSTLMLCSLLLHSPLAPTALLAHWQCELLCVPALLLASYAFLASLLMLLALATDIQCLIIPFLLSCVLNMMGSMALGLVLLLNPLEAYQGGRLSVVIGPRATALVPAALALCSSGLVVCHLCILLLGAFTYVLIRDKRSLFIEYFSGDLLDDEEGSRLLLRRCSSAPDPLDRVNSAEF